MTQFGVRICGKVGKFSVQINKAPFQTFLPKDNENSLKIKNVRICFLFYWIQHLYSNIFFL